MFTIRTMQHQNGADPMTEEIAGYLALGFGVIAMGMKKLMMLRIVHAFSAMSYIVYGSMIHAIPIIIGGSTFLVIHAYHLIRLWKKTT